MSINTAFQAVLTNQQTIIKTLSTILTAVQGIPGANNTAITTALSQIESQVADIQTQIDGVTAGSPTPTPTPSSASGSGTSTTGATS